MDIESVKNKDVLQLQQTIIFLKSEIAKYQNEISSLQSMDYYSMVNSLEQELSQLVNEKKELSMELMMLRKSFEKELNELHENIQLREEQRVKLISSIESLVEKKENLQKENKQLKETIEKTAKTDIPAARSESYIQAVEELDHLLRSFMNSNNEQLISLRETINQQHDLLKDIKNKNEEIQFTLEEMTQIKEPEHNNYSPTDEQTITRINLENQLQNLFIQATSFETELDEKLRILDEFDDKLLLLAIEIEKHKKGDI
ncbi:multidrug ABC transporter ATPase [Solibacillus sp. FSL W7-1464]|uniref:multidrug ABC transporter ATPase n=1 Tax=Solibacillus sp. FSL W7-1464 TaxID=2921706 RepID=UPI0030F8C634